MTDDSISPLESTQEKVVFKSPNLNLDLRYVIDVSPDRQPPDHAGKPIPKCEFSFEELDLRSKGHKGPSIQCDFTMAEGSIVTFILRDLPQKEGSNGNAKDHPLFKEANSQAEKKEGARPHPW